MKLGIAYTHTHTHTYIYIYPQLVYFTLAGTSDAGFGEADAESSIIYGCINRKFPPRITKSHDKKDKGLVSFALLTFRSNFFVVPSLKLALGRY